MSNSSKLSRLPDSDKMLSEAASWVAQIDSGRLKRADRKALREWASRSPRHIEELRRVAATWVGMDATLEAILSQTESGFSWPHLISLSVKNRPRLVLGSLSIGSLTATCAVAIAVNVLYLNPAKLNFSSTYTVAQGDKLQVDLPDKSIMELNSGSIAEVSFDKHSRSVRLLKGEGYFDVESNKDRPFTVLADGNFVKAVGTAFSVRVDDGQTSVLVTEGKVVFQRLENTNANIISPIVGANTPLVIAGHAASITNSGGKVASLELEEINKKLSWREGMMVFKGDTLEYVINEVSRYDDIEIVISDPAIRDKTIGGTFPIGKTEFLLTALESSFGVSVDEVEKGVFYLSAKSN